MYDVWDAHQERLVSAGHADVDAASAFIERIRRDLARHIDSSHPDDDVILSFEVRNMLTNETVAWDWGGFAAFR